MVCSSAAKAVIGLLLPGSLLRDSARNSPFMAASKQVQGSSVNTVLGV
jgi:hypothetical protein